MARADDDHIPSNFTTRDTAKAFRDAQGRLVPQRPHAPLLYGPDGGPRWSEAAENYLDRVGVQVNSADAEKTACDELGDLDDERQAALARLQVEHARLFGVIFLTDVRGLSLRETGRYLGMDHKTVRRHRAKGMAHIMAWCANERQAG